jgi:DNA-binding CsgD family transcriptional regulator
VRGEIVPIWTRPAGVLARPQRLTFGLVDEWGPAEGPRRAGSASPPWGFRVTQPLPMANEEATAVEEGHGPDPAADDQHLAAVYTLLIDQPGLDLAQFAARLGITEDAVRGIFNRLADLALLYPTQSEHGPLVANSPLAAMQQLIAREQSILHQRQQFLQRSAGTFSSILSAYGGAADPSDGDRLAEQLTDLPSTRRRLQELAMSAKESVLSFSPGALNPTATRNASRPLDLDALARGVRMQTMYLDTIAFDPDALAYAQELADAGADIRLVPELPMRMIIIDGNAVIVPRKPCRDAEGAVVVRQESIVRALIALFECYWACGRPLPGTALRPHECNSAELAVVRLLATGAKDDAVARQLGTSVRTIRRIIGLLMMRADVSSRFEFGVYASTHDWV